MRSLAGVSAILAGLLLIIVPRYILPACEFEGFSRMHCSDTAQAERILGGLFILAGGLILAVRSTRLRAAGSAVFLLLLSAAAYVIPDRFGYCHNPKMPCNYGMVPALRLIGVVSGIVAAAVIVTLLLRERKKGTA